MGADYSFAKPLARGLCIAFLSAVSCTHADTLHFTNGKEFHGKIERKTGGKIYFLADGIGEIVVPEDVATAIDEIKMPLPTQEPSSPEPTAAAAIVPVKITQTAAAQPGKWTGKIELGYLNETGPTSITTSSLAAEFNYTSGTNSFKLSDQYVYAESLNVVSTEREQAEFRFRHDLNNRFFFQAVTSYISDKIRQIHYQIDQDAGIGYHIINNPRETASAGVSLAGDDRYAFGTAQTITPLGKFFQDLSWKITPWLSFSEEGNVQYSPISRGTLILLANNTTAPVSSDAKNYMLHVQSAIESKIYKKLSLILKYQYDYDNVVAVPSLRAENQLTSSVAYTF